MVPAPASSTCEFTYVHRPATGRYIILAARPPFSLSFLLFFFILTFAGLRAIKKSRKQDRRPALHIVEPTSLDCLSGPSWR